MPSSFASFWLTDGASVGFTQVVGRSFLLVSREGIGNDGVPRTIDGS
jgi:hypothetical protein